MSNITVTWETMEDIIEEEKQTREMILQCEIAEKNFRNAIVEMLDTCSSLESMRTILDEEFKRFPGVKSVKNFHNDK